MSETFPAAPLAMAPIFSVRPWGGRLLETRLGKSLPDEKPYGEAWELSDHPNGRSCIAGGPFAGMEFGSLVRTYPRETVGRAHAPARYPLLVKIISAEQDLSIQVHPDDSYASRHGDRGKTECWYILDCEPETEIIFGLNPGVTREDLEQGAADGRIESMVSRRPIKPSDFLFVRPGTVHAILGGTVLCEIQQSSDTTYRLWDWRRKPERELHVQQSLDVIDFAPSPPEIETVGETGRLVAPRILTENEFFRVQVLDAPPSEPIDLPPGLSPSGQIVCCVAGSGSLKSAEGKVDLALGATAFLPALCEGQGQVWAAGDRPARFLLAESREL